MPTWDPDGYRGTVAVGAGVPELGDESFVTALDLWSHGLTIRGTAIDHPARPTSMRPMGWTFATDLRTSHLFHGGGGGGLTWDFKFQPELPADARSVSLFVADEPGMPGHPPVIPADPVLTVALPAPVPVRRAPARLDPAPPADGPAVLADPPRPVSPPSRTIPVATVLDGLDRDLVVLSIDARPTWFALHVGGGGPLTLMPTRDNPSTRMMRHLWTVEDEGGRRYLGTVRCTGSGFPWIATAVMWPGLDPGARRLRLGFPYPFSTGTVTTEVALPGR